MSELLTALGLMFVLEGALYALFPDYMKRMMFMLLALPVQQIRAFGLIFAVFGFLMVATIRGF
jgi:uncharacterized protein YjeT (DUF2065 family)